MGAIFIPSYFWLVKRKPFYIFSYVFNYLNKEFSIALGGLKSQGLTHIFISIFLFISVFLNLGRFLAHLVPLGTPYALMPFMVVIELVRRIIRPLTLSVRLAANIVAGHLLMVLVRSPITTIRLNFIALVISALLLLIMLELAVSFIQAYVFSTLISLYVIEVNSPNL